MAQEVRADTAGCVSAPTVIPGRGAVCASAHVRICPGAPGNRRPYRKKEKPGERLTALLHHITPEALGEAYHALKRDAAPGVDGMTWREYGDGLEERLLDLHDRVRRGAYRAKPVRRVMIPKPDGGVRPRMPERRSTCSMSRK